MEDRGVVVALGLIIENRPGRREVRGLNLGDVALAAVTLAR